MARIHAISFENSFASELTEPPSVIATGYTLDSSGLVIGSGLMAIMHAIKLPCGFLEANYCFSSCGCLGS